MRRVVVGLLMACFSCSASSEPESEVDLCAEISSLANTVMTARQANMPMSQLMEIARKSGDDDGLYVILVEEAYESPAYQTKQAQTSEIRDFENKWYLDCYKARKKGGK